jgi:hypothetical protein
VDPAVPAEIHELQRLAALGPEEVCDHRVPYALIELRLALAVP